MKIKIYFSMNSLDRKQEIQVNVNKKVDFLNFQKIKNSEGINIGFYKKQIEEFKEKNPYGYNILKNMDKFLEKNKLNNTKSILASILFISELQEKKGDKALKIIENIVVKKPALLTYLIKGFYDDVEIKQKAEETKQEANKTKQKVENSNKKIDNIQEAYKKLAKKINSQLEQLNPELNNQIKEKANEIKNKYPEISEDQAYLITFDYFYQKEPSLQKELKLDDQELLLIHSVREKFSDIKINAILEYKEVKKEFDEFVSSSEYNEMLSSKLEKASFDLETQKLLGEKYPAFVNEALSRIAQDNKLNLEELKVNYQNYLNGEHTKYDKIYEKIGQQLVKKFNEQLNMFPQEYKKIAIQEYTKSIFSMLDKAVGMYSLQANFDKSDKFGIDNGNISLSLSYEGTPLDIEVTKDGSILMTNYLARENQDANGLDISQDGAFQVKKTKVNNFFSFVGLNEILNIDSFSYKNLLEGGNNLKSSMQENIKKLVEVKIQENNILGNVSVMKEELSYHIENQKIAYDMIKFYRPPVENNYLEGNGKIGEDKQGLFILMNRLDRTANLDERTQDILENFYSNEKIKYLLSSLDKVKVDDKPLSTYEFFKKIGFLGIEGRLNLNKIEKFTLQIEKVNTELDLRHLPELEDLEWEVLASGKIRLKEKEEVDDLSLFEDISLSFEEKTG